MPNGSTDWTEKELPELETFFCKIAGILVDFSSVHNLMIDKYYHQGPNWTLRFQHPEGGVGNITIQKRGDAQVWIGTSWWIDDYDNNRRDVKHEGRNKSSLEKDQLFGILTGSLKTILAWRKKDLIKGRPNPYSDWKNEISKEEFEGQLKKYPIPKLD